MKTLFLMFHGLNPTDGINKKIYYQANALRACGINTRLCYLNESDGRKLRMIDSEVLWDYGTGFEGKVLKRVEYSSIVECAKKENISSVYIRPDHNTNSFTIHIVHQMRKVGIKVVMEIPTYPYDQEYVGFSHRKLLFIDQYFHHLLAEQLCGIMTFSNYKTIFDIPTTQISNGTDFSRIRLKQQVNDTDKGLHLVGVAEIHYWHGFDRLVKDLADYYDSHPNYKIFSRIVGDFFGQREEDDIPPTIKQHELESYVTLRGAKHDEELDQLFEKADMAIGSLARHRSGTTRIRTLKNRKYATRDLFFIYSETDSDFENKPYILKVLANETAIDINSLMHFYEKQSLSPPEIRESIRPLSWETQMSRIANSIKIS